MSSQYEVVPIKYAPLSQGEVVAALHNAFSTSTISVEDAEGVVRDKLGTVLTIDGSHRSNNCGVVDVVKKVRIDVFFIDDKNLSVCQDRYDDVKRVIECELMKIGIPKVCPAAVEIAKTYLSKIKLLLMAACLIGQFNVFALTEIVDGIEWTFEENGDEVVLRNNTTSEYDLEYDGTTASCNLKSVIDNTINHSILRVPSVLNGKPVTAIGELAFTGCSIENLIIPSSVKRIATSMFQKLGGYVVSSSQYCFFPTSLSAPKNILFEGDFPSVSGPSGDGFRCYRAMYSCYNSSRNRDYYLLVDAYRDGYTAISSSKVWVYDEKNITTFTRVPGDSRKYFAAAPIYVLPSVVAEPGDRTIISDAITVTLQGGNTIYYTMDGTEPKAEVTDNCFRYTSPIAVSKACVIKAIAVAKDCPFVKTCVFSYANGKVSSPSVSISSGYDFDKSDTAVEIACLTDDAVIRYTTDGSEVSENSPAYLGPFMISETTTVRAKAFKEDWFDSDEVCQVFTRVWHEATAPIIQPASATFDGASLEVSISCETDGATVYYTTDGSEPSAINGRKYTGPFSVYDSVEVKAVAIKDDWKASSVTVASFTKNNALSAAINLYEYLPDNDANSPWTVDTEVAHDGVSSVRSGAISHGETTVMTVSVRGQGRLSFWWKSECEESDEDFYDYGAFRVGSETEPRLRIAGKTDWKRETIEFDTTGKHVLKWEYHKDDAETVPRDCVWVDQVQWLPYGESEHDHTLTTEIPVPYLWLDSYGLGVESDFEMAAKSIAANGINKVCEAYLIGLDPTDSAAKFISSIAIEDGKPVVTWNPDLGDARAYTILGSTDLKTWTPVEEGRVSDYNFFKVTVEMK